MINRSLHGPVYLAMALMLLGLAPMAALPAESASAGSATPSAGSQSLLLLVRANPETTPDRIKATLLAGIKQAGCSCTSIQIREVDPRVIDQLEATLRMLEPTSKGWVNRVTSKLELRKTELQTWEIRLPAPTLDWIEKLEVWYDRAQEWVSYEPVPPEKAQIPGLIVISVRNGLYEFRPDEQKGRPAKYRVHYSGSHSPKVDEGDFPLVDKCYVINLLDFVGDKTQLFDVVKDKDKVANPFTDIRERTNVTLVFGSIDARSATTGETVVGTDLFVSVSGVAGRSPSRAWMLFPLTQEEAQRTAATIDKLPDPSVALPEFIRKNAASPDQAVLELPGPRWFELAPSGSGFEGRIKLARRIEDLGSLVQKYPRMYRILVWEFEYPNNSSREAIYVEAPGGDRLYIMEEMSSWDRILKQALQGNP